MIRILMTPKEAEDVCDENDYRDYRRFEHLGRDACIARIGMMWCILADISVAGYGDRWDYDHYPRAKAALENWNGEVEPFGWFRHPDTGRRRENGNPATEYVNY